MSFKKFHLLILCITGYLAMAGGALLAPALPEMVVPLQTTAQTTGLLMSVFTLSTAIFTLILGHFIDRADRKKILIPSLVVYGLTGIISFFITNFEHLSGLHSSCGSKQRAISMSGLWEPVLSLQKRRIRNQTGEKIKISC